MAHNRHGRSVFDGQAWRSGLDGRGLLDPDRFGEFAKSGGLDRRRCLRGSNAFGEGE